MVIENNVLVTNMVNCIIHCMCILLKWRDKWYGKYLMGKAFSSDPEIQDGRIYAVTRLIHNYTPSDCYEPSSKYSDDQLAAQIHEDKITDIRDVSPRIPQYRK